jgi:hypothetical protein
MPAASHEVKVANGEYYSQRRACGHLCHSGQLTMASSVSRSFTRAR